MGVAAEYRLREELGHGALGRVVVVEDAATGQTFAGKILHASLQGDPGSVERFRREAELLRTVRHPNIVAVHGLHTIDGVEVLLMERIDGPSLATLLAEEGTLPERRLIALARGIAQGLSAAHRAGIVHRDLKPHNVLVAPGDVAKIVDFNLARASSYAGIDRRHFTIVGTPDYMAPESIDPLAVDPRSDLYSLGCILFELTAGRPPFSGGTAFALLEAHLREPVPELAAGPERSPALVALVRALLAKSPADRPQSATLVDAVLAAIASGRTGGAERSLVDARPRDMARSGACARCGEAILDGIPICFGCGLEQSWLEPGRSTLFVVGPGALA